jgi:hypothetical protein
MPPTHTGAYLLPVEVMTEGDNDIDQSAISVALVPFHEHLLAMNPLGEVLARAIGEWLPLLRRIDAGELNPVLLLCGIEHRDRIAVGYSNHTAVQLVGIGNERTEKDRCTFWPSGRLILACQSPKG